MTSLPGDQGYQKQPPERSTCFTSPPLDGRLGNAFGRLCINVDNLLPIPIADGERWSLGGQHFSNPFTAGRSLRLDLPVLDRRNIDRETVLNRVVLLDQI